MKKILKRLLLGLAITVITALVIFYVQFEKVIRVAGNTALEGTGFQIVHLDIKPLPTPRVRVPRMEMSGQNGTRIVIIDLVLSGDLLFEAQGYISIGEIVVTPGESAGGVLEPGKVLDDVFQLPYLLPDLTILVGRAVVGDLPVMTGIEWQTASQRLSFKVASIDVSLAVDRNGDAENVRITGKIAEENLLSAELDVRKLDSRYEMDGDLSLQPVIVLPFLGMFGLDQVSLGEGRVESILQVTIEDENVTLRSKVQIPEPLHISVPEIDAEIMGSDIELDFNYPSLQWFIQSREVYVVTHSDRLPRSDSHLTNFRCQSPLRCEFSATVDSGSLDISGAHFGGVTIQAESVVSMDDEIEVAISDSTVSLAAVNTEDTVIASLAAALDSGLKVQGRVTYDRDSGFAVIDLPEIALRFDQGVDVNKWPFKGDVVTGEISASIAATWQQDELTASGSFQGRNVSGFYQSLAFTNLATEFKLNVHDNTFSIVDGELAIALIDIGLPIASLAVVFSADQTQLSIAKASMQALGGRIQIDPFTLNIAERTGTVNVRLDEIQLPFMVSLAKFDSTIEASGSVSGLLPLTIAGESITMSAGSVRNDPPGGVIKYLPGAESTDSMSPLDQATRALGNFHFDTLSSAVEYDSGGNLSLGVRLEGINPVSDPLQPVILNLKLENNIPQMLRSLQGTRQVEDIVNRRAAQ